MCAVPMLTYALEACPLSYADKHSLEFVTTRTFMKVFKTNSVSIVKECQIMFRFRQISEVILYRKRKFLLKYCETVNNVCENFSETARTELTSLN